MLSNETRLLPAYAALHLPALASDRQALWRVFAYPQTCLAGAQAFRRGRQALRAPALDKRFKKKLPDLLVILPVGLGLAVLEFLELAVEERNAFEAGGVADLADLLVGFNEEFA